MPSVGGLIPMEVNVTVETRIPKSFRVDQVAGMFDVPLGDTSSESFNVEIPGTEEDWKIGVIVGPSGSGKSSVARKVYGDNLVGASEWAADKAVVDCFGKLGIKTITAALTAVGFSSPPAWVRPYHVLSNGQKFRCDLARAMLERSELLAFDEFTSVVDRTVAKIGSAAIAKSVRAGRTCKRFVAVSCHYDIVDWLEPDWVLDMASGKLARGSLWRRPPIQLDIRESHPRHWGIFAKHHYLNTKTLHGGGKAYVGEIGGEPVCFVYVRQNAGHKGLKRISRIVTLPDYQGVGVGLAVLNAVAEITIARGASGVSITTGHPAMMHALQKTGRWRCSNFSKQGSSANSNKTTRVIGEARGRAIASFRFRPTP